MYLPKNIVNSTMIDLQFYDPWHLKHAILNYTDDESEEESWTKVMRQVWKWRKQSRVMKKVPSRE